jgi:ribosome-binding factor A
MGESLNRPVTPSLNFLMDPEYRHHRLADQIRGEVAEMIEGELKDPRIGFVTVTRVDLSPDFSHARVLLSIMGDEQARKDSLNGLQSAVGYVRRGVTQRLRLRRAPEITFAIDRGAEEAVRIEELLGKIRMGE